MSAGPEPAVSLDAPRVSRHGHRSRRGGHPNTPREGTNLSTSSVPSGASRSASTLLPGLVMPQNQQTLPTVSEYSGASGNGPKGRGGRGSRPGRRGGARNHTISGSGRAFGGQLTRGEPPAGTLQADAPEFQPGQPIQTRQ